MQTTPLDRGTTLHLALALLREIALDGLRHGYFDYQITCEIVNGRKRRLVIRAGKCHQFTIPEDELPPN